MVSDVCTCTSPALNTTDWKKLKRPSAPEKMKFFARKFDPILDQNIVAKAEQQASKVPIEQDDVYESYWQNEYHVSDRHTKVDPSMTIFLKAVGQVAYHNFYLYQSIKSDCKLGKPTEMTYYKAKENSPVDMIVRVPVKCNDRKTKDHIEILVRRKIIWTVTTKVTELTINAMEVNVQFDIAMQGFKNFPGILGQKNADPTLWYNVTTYPLKTAGSVVIVKVAWIGPGDGSDYLEASKQQLKLEATTAYFSILNLVSVKDKTLKPGKWTARLLANDILNLAEIVFPVFPGETGDLDLAVNLVKEFYDIQEVCKILGKDSELKIQLLKDCSDVKWSTVYPDMKSDFDFSWKIP